jgi:hypothetical protein
MIQSILIEIIVITKRATGGGGYCCFLSKGFVAWNRNENPNISVWEKGQKGFCPLHVHQSTAAVVTKHTALPNDGIPFG